MSGRVLISVTEGDIQNGRRMNQFSCPIALASKRTLGFDVYANGYGINRLYSAATGPLLYTMSKSTKRRMGIFDRSGRMKPFRFFATPVEPRSV